MRFLAGVAAILLFAFGAIPAVQRLGAIRDVRRVIEDHDVDATALIYSESEVSCEAETSIRNAIRYAARPAGGSGSFGGEPAGRSNRK